MTGELTRPRDSDQHGWDRTLERTPFVERFWRSLKYEEVYLYAYETIADAQQGVGRYLAFYNQIRLHRVLKGRTPEDGYHNHLPRRHPAA